MSIQHKNIPDAQIHATKGASSASANTVKYADGAGGEGWAKVNSSMINTSSIFNVNKVWIHVDYDTTFGASVTSPVYLYIPCPYTGTVDKVWAVDKKDSSVTNAINNVALFNNNTSTLMTGSSLTWTTSGVESSNVTSNNSVTSGNFIAVRISTSATGSSIRLSTHVVIQITLTA